MSRIPLHSIETAPPEAKERLSAAAKASGYLPNLLRLLANAPAALEAYQTASAINARSSLSATEREVVQIRAGATHGCAFCVAGHTAIARKKVGIDDDTVEGLRSGTRLDDRRLDALARFTEAVIATRGAVADSELARFRAAGYGDRQALEVVLGVSLATLCNFSNNLGKTPLNPELEAYEWQPGARAAAE